MMQRQCSDGILISFCVIAALRCLNFRNVKVVYNILSVIRLAYKITSFSELYLNHLKEMLLALAILTMTI